MFRPDAVVSESARRTRRLLFEPFDPLKYAVLGFAVWLTSPGDAMAPGCGGPPIHLNFEDVDFAWWLDRVGGWYVVVALIVAFVAVALVVGVFVAFLECRATFLALDGIVRDRVDLAAAWSAYAPEANALFAFRVLLFGAVLAGVACCYAVATAVMARWEPEGPEGVLVFTVIGLATAPATASVMAGALLNFAVTEFVVPLMYARRVGVRDGLRELGGLVLRDGATVVIYVVVRALAGFVIAVLLALATALTFGLPTIPYVGLLAVLPAPVFLRILPLVFLEQVIPDLSFSPDPSPDRPPSG